MFRICRYYVSIIKETVNKRAMNTFDARQISKSGTVMHFPMRTEMPKNSDTVFSIKSGMILNDKYEIIEQIGRGGTFDVFLARDTRLNLKWAVKVTRSNSTVSIQSAKCEAEMLKELDHPLIPKLAEAYTVEDKTVIVQEYIHGMTLERIVESYGAQSVEKVVDWTRQICNVIGYLHSLEPAHIYRDVKPANFILEPSGRLRIIDFGIMRTYKDGQTSDTCCLGTNGYAAPEQFGGRGQTDPRTDIYAIGITMYRLLTGQNVCERSFLLNPIEKNEPGISSGLAYIMNKCTRFNPRERYASCEKLLNDLNRYNQLPPRKSFLSRLKKR